MKSEQKTYTYGCVRKPEEVKFQNYVQRPFRQNGFCIEIDDLLCSGADQTAPATPLRHTGKPSQGRHSQFQEPCSGHPRSCQSFPKIARGSLRHHRDTVATPLRHLTGNLWPQSRFGGALPAIPSRRLRQRCDLMAATLLRPGLCDTRRHKGVTGAV